MRTLFIVNEPPYGTERVYNAFMAGARRSTMDELAAVTVESDKVLVF